MFQPGIHLGYFFELQLIQQDIEQIDKEFQEMTKKIVAEFKTTETLQDSTQVRNLANSSHESKKKYEKVLASFYQSKIFESFLTTFMYLWRQIESKIKAGLDFW